MKASRILLTVLIALCVIGCRTTNPETGKSEFDPVKTEKAKAIVKGQVATVVGLIVGNNPEGRPHFARAAAGICQLRDERKIGIEAFKTALNSALKDWPAASRPEILAGVNAIIAIVELNYADRLSTDLPEEQFVWNLFDVVCEGINQGLAPTQ